MAKIAILGSGAYGSAQANNLLLNKKNEVLVYGIDKTELDDIKLCYNKRYFQENKFHRPLSVVTDSIDEVVSFDPEIILVGVPTFAIHDVLDKTLPKLKKGTKYIFVSKGFDYGTKSLISDVLKPKVEKSGSEFVYLAGPGFAVDIFNGNYTVVNVSCSKPTFSFLKKVFNTKTFKIQYCNDLEGMEFVAAIKNIYAIGMGYISGKYESINTSAAFFTQAVSEVYSILKELKYKSVTMLQYCGIGDLYLTCSDSKSRNNSLGYNIAKKGLEQALAENQKTVEGHAAAKLFKESYWPKLKKNKKYTFLAEIFNILNIN